MPVKESCSSRITPDALIILDPNNDTKTSNLLSVNQRHHRTCYLAMFSVVMKSAHVPIHALGLPEMLSL